MSNAELLSQIKTNLLETIAEITDPATRKVSYSVDGQSVSWTEYLRLLFDQLKTVNEQLNAETVYEIRSGVI